MSITGNLFEQIMEGITKMLGLEELIDPFVVVVGAGVFAVSAAFLYFVSIVGVKEKSYEEALSEQRQQFQNAVPDVSKRKAKTKWMKQKKGEKKQRGDAAGAQDGAASHGQSSKDTEQSSGGDVPGDGKISRDFDSAPTEAKNTKSGKQSKQQKSGKEQARKREDLAAPTSPKNATNESSKQVTSKGEDVSSKVGAARVELKEAKDKGQANKKDKKKQQLNGVSEVHLVEQEQLVQSDVVFKKETYVEDVVQPPPPATSSPSARKRNKNAKDAIADAGGAGDNGTQATRLINMVKSTLLNDQDIQVLVEMLLNKRDGSDGTQSIWLKKGQKLQDSAPALKKQLEEKEALLYRAQQLNYQNVQKLKSMKNEMAQECFRYRRLEQQCKEKIVTQEQELDQMKQRMSGDREQHMKEVVMLRSELASRKQATISHNQQALQQQQIQHLTEENLRLKEVVESSGRVHQDMKMVQLQLKQQEQAKKDAEMKCRDFQERLKKAETDEEEQTKQVQETEGRSKNLEAMNQKLQDELAALQSSLEDVSKQHREWEVRMGREKEEIFSKCQQQDTALATVMSENDVLKARCSALETDLSAAKNEYNKLSTEVDELRSAGSDAQQPNGTVGESEVTDEVPRGDDVDQISPPAHLAEKHADGDATWLATESNDASDEIM